MFQPEHFIVNILHRNVLYCVILYSLTELIKYGVRISHIPCIPNERYPCMMKWMMFKTCWAVENHYFNSISSGNVQLVGMQHTEIIVIPDSAVHCNIEGCYCGNIYNEKILSM